MKNGRQEQILRLIREYDIETQKELADRLRESGYDATQATVSRDIRALKLTKTPMADGRGRYTEPRQSMEPQKYQRVLRESVVSVREAQAMIVIRTVPGMAMAAAASVDEWNHGEIAGCIAGDDTIFCALAPDADAKSILRQLQEITEG